MNTIRVLVPNQIDAQMLLRLLQTMKIVENAEFEVKEKESDKNQFLILNSILQSKASAKNFKEITDPVSWQKGLRDEWE
jgi:hypothetical protein